MLTLGSVLAPRKLAAVAGSVFALALVTAAPARAQSVTELMKIIQAQAEMIDELKGRMDRVEGKATDAEIKATAAADTAKAAKEAADNAGSGDLDIKWGPSPTFKSKDGQYEMHVRGRVLADFGHVKDREDVQNRNATEFRAARLGIEGKAGKRVKYKFEADFADNEVDITDALIEYAVSELFNVVVGHFKAYASMEELTSSRHISLVERGSFTDAWALGRRLGIAVEGGGANWLFGLAIQGGSDLAENSDNEGTAFSFRVAFFPQLGNKGRIHVGAWALIRNYSNDFEEMGFRYRQRPHAHTSGVRYVDTGTLMGLDKDVSFGVELAGIFGPFWAEAEWSWLKAKVDDAYTFLYAGEDSIGFAGGYFGIGWFVTGESRGYKNGGWDRPKVKKPIGKGGGLGAVALVARVDYIDLIDSSALVYGGDQLTFIFGANWYLNNHVVIKVNYAHSSVDDAFDNLGDTDAFGKNKINSFTARFQVDW